MITNCIILSFLNYQILVFDVMVMYYIVIHIVRSNNELVLIVDFF